MEAIQKGRIDWRSLFRSNPANSEKSPLASGRGRRYMRKLKGDVPASDKQNLPREVVQIQELIARRKVLSAGNPHICRYHSCCNNDVPSLQCISLHLNCSWPG